MLTEKDLERYERLNFKFPRRQYRFPVTQLPSNEEELNIEAREGVIYVRKEDCSFEHEWDRVCRMREDCHPLVLGGNFRPFRTSGNPWYEDPRRRRKPTSGNDVDIDKHLNK